MHIQFKRPQSLPLLPGNASPVTDSPPENLDANVQCQLQGVLTVFVIAPDDDQKCFALVPVASRPDMMKLPWVRSTMQLLQPAVGRIFDQSLLQARLTPSGDVVQAGCATDQQGRLIYTFQISVTNFLPQNAAGPVPANDVRRGPDEP